MNTDPDDDDADDTDDYTPGPEPTEFFGDELFSRPVVSGDLKGDALLPPKGAGADAPPG